MRALEKLHEIKWKPRAPVAFTAKMVLEDWRAGKLSLPS
jgi:hypothetical protein